MPTLMDFVSKLNALTDGFAFSHWGWTALSEPVSIALYRDWLAAGHHATMSYLERHLPAKADPQVQWPRARSAIVIARPYLPHPYPSPTLAARTALYARGEDYHFHFQSELQSLARLLEAEFPGEEFLCFTDSAPILERDLAVQAGLGWIGKNGCLIHPQKGSLFFIGEILSTLPAPLKPTVRPDMCGTCDRCVRACPTAAIQPNRTLDASRCIAYWTIEAREPAPVEIRAQLGDWFFGCDICQTVCPWNEKVFGRENMRAESLTPQTRSARETLIADLNSILTSTNAALRARFAGLPYLRSRALGLKRNALYVSANLRLAELNPILQDLRADPDLGELADWALALINSP